MQEFTKEYELNDVNTFLSLNDTDILLSANQSNIVESDLIDLTIIVKVTEKLLSQIKENLRIYGVKDRILEGYNISHSVKADIKLKTMRMI